MATLTYNPNEAPADELNAEEQESLVVGEQMEQQQQQLLAGKFKDAEDVEKAYIELQSKLGQESSKPEANTEQADAPEDQPSDSFLDTLWDEAQSQSFSEDTVKRLQEMNPGELAKMYLDERASNVRPQATSEDAQNLRNQVGGDEAYAGMIKWASENFTEQEVSMYDSIMESADPNAMYFAIQALNNRYQNANGVEGTLITGKGVPKTNDGYRSQAEVVRAMSDPRYDSDPAYRQDVAAKLERSNIDF